MSDAEDRPDTEGRPHAVDPPPELDTGWHPVPPPAAAGGPDVPPVPGIVPEQAFEGSAEPKDEGSGLPSFETEQGASDQAAEVSATPWGETAVAAASGSEEQGWPTPWTGSDSGPRALLPGSAGQEPPPPPPPPHAPLGQSRNPVDRLTRGLPTPLRVAIDWMVTIVGAVAIVLLVKAFVVNPYRIPSSSMERTLHCGRPAIGCEARYSDRVLANRFLYRIRDPRRGEIVVFETPPAAQLKCGAGGTFVKRVVGLPGDVVEVKLRGGDGYVYINGKPLKEPYIEKDRRGAGQEFGPLRIKPDNYFMMGDNRSQSCDSRMWGTVPRDNLIGKVFATYWPPNRVSLH